MLEYSDEEFVCSGCEEPISGSCYSCASCNFFLHKKCAILPQKIRHHLHREHPLLLLPEPPPYYNNQGFVCDICKKSGRSFVYHCSLCGFDLDVKCAHPPCLLEANNQLQGHQFRCLKPSIPSFTCNACGTDGDDPFLCTMCLIMVHDKCISLPQTIKLFMHHHPQIMHTYSIGGRFLKQYCGICREVVKEGFGGYCCPYCEFVAHVPCALDNKALESESEGEEKELGTSVDDEILMEPATYIVREINQGTEVVIVELKHFSHQHNLILLDDVKYGLKCAGCMFPISSPYYGCAECNCFLDKFCIELPRQQKVYGQHPSTLLSKACTSDGVFFCPFCEKYRHGFCYRTNDDRVADVRCFHLVKNLMIEHESHEHPLFVSSNESEYICNACGDTLQSELKCSDCRFNLHGTCATLPDTAWHKYDDHPLSLTYIDPNTYQFYCLICEKERDPKLWFYRCEVCDFDAHVECALGKYPYIKFGGTYTYGLHSHPLGLVENIEGDHTCNVCDKPCNDFVLGCTISDCNFVAHRRCLPMDDSGNRAE